MLTFGPFSYVNEDKPPFDVVEAARLYEHFGFDVGASVDHIPLPEIEVMKKGKAAKRKLSKREQAERVKLTIDNAEAFLKAHADKKYRFTPMGVVQGFTAKSYVENVQKYLDMGYKHIALGGRRGS